MAEREISFEKERIINDLILAEQALYRSLHNMSGEERLYTEAAIKANILAQDEIIKGIPRSKLLERFPYLCMRLGGENNDYEK
jgi:hypothetical protein